MNEKTKIRLVYLLGQMDAKFHQFRWEAEKLLVWGEETKTREIAQELIDLLKTWEEIIK